MDTSQKQSRKMNQTPHKYLKNFVRCGLYETLYEQFVEVKKNEFEKLLYSLKNQDLPLFNEYEKYVRKMLTEGKTPEKYYVFESIIKNFKN